MAKIKSSNEIYDVIESALTDTPQALTAVELMERPEVRRSAIERFGTDIQITTNKLSDLLGFMWRREVLDRFNATDARTKSRYAYKLKSSQNIDLKPIAHAPAKSSLKITETTGGVVIELDTFSIIIQKR